MSPISSKGAGVSVVTLHSFDDSYFYNGEAPSSSLVQGANGLFYGTTLEGGSANAGVIFEVGSNGAVNTLYTFTGGVDGAFPQAGLYLANDGNFYGTTIEGGTNGAGTLFRITPGGIFTSLYSFTALSKAATNQDGAYPGASLVQASDGNLYGTASSGGSNGSGTLFKISLGGSFQLVYAFSALNGYYDNSEGSDPEAALVQGANGVLYGTAYAGGSNGFGTVFAYSLAQNQMTSLHSFQKAITGANLMAALVQGQDGAFYGTTSQGGSKTNGTMFKMTSTGGFALLHVFTGGTDGANPLAPLVQGANGSFYGTCANLESGFGTVFEATTNGTVLPLYAFTGEHDGANPVAALLEAAGGGFWGTASSGGSNNAGAIFSITSAGAFTPVMSFMGGGDGSHPQAPLVQGANGNFYGTTYQGGATGDGVVFEVTANGMFTTLYSFTNGLDGGFPASGLTLGTDGNFYGESVSGGADHSGITFKVTPEGTLTVLHAFTGDADGSVPIGGLAQGTNGIFYGTTYNGGYGQSYYGHGGTIFEMDAEGVTMPLYTFTNGYDGANPRGGLALGTDGNLYGTTTSGGLLFPYPDDNEVGTIFKVTPDGVLTPLHAFTNGLDGELPVCKLVQWTGGNFYGTACKGGTHRHGAVFMITPAGSFTSLYSFTNGIDGAAPNAGLVEGPGGYLFGTAAGGGTYGLGTIFEMSSNGGFTALYSFTGTNDGSSPVAPLVLGSDGNLYGTTSLGGVADSGTAFKLVLSPLAAPSFTSIVSGPALTTLTWSTVPGQMYQLQFAAKLNANAWANLGAPTNGGNGLASFADTNIGNAQRFFRVNTYLK
ncbi:MAG: choice-of-anchor tandem repeat GloVer-containing protein [Limisphaerales bacterium]